jgi:replication factor C small subunit
MGVLFGRPFYLFKEMIMTDLKANVDTSIWVEKYRPNSIDQCLLPDEVKKSFRKYIEEKDCPHLLFYSRSAGTGKTCSAKILSKAIGGDDILWINASLNRGIDVIRDSVEQFCTRSSFSGNLKIIVCEEFDNVTDDAQKALREMMERYYEYARFIFTCNYVHKILDPIRSRTQEYDFGSVKPIEVVKMCLSILSNEGVKIDDETKTTVVKIVKDQKSDMRKTINEIQRLTSGDTLNPYTTTNEKLSNLADMIRTKKLTEARKFLGEHSINVDGAIKYLMDNAKDLSENKWPDIMIELGEVAYRTKIGVDPDVAFTAGMAAIMQMIK